MTFTCINLCLPSYKEFHVNYIIWHEQGRMEHWTCICKSNNIISNHNMVTNKTLVSLVTVNRGRSITLACSHILWWASLVVAISAFCPSLYIMPICQSSQPACLPTCPPTISVLTLYIYISEGFEQNNSESGVKVWRWRLWRHVIEQVFWTVESYPDCKKLHTTIVG